MFIIYLHSRNRKTFLIWECCRQPRLLCQFVRIMLYRGFRLSGNREFLWKHISPGDAQWPEDSVSVWPLAAEVGSEERPAMERWGWGSELIPVLNFGYFPQQIDDEINNITEEFLPMVTRQSKQTNQFYLSTLQDLNLIESNIRNQFKVWSKTPLIVINCHNCVT